MAVKKLPRKTSRVFVKVACIRAGIHEFAYSVARVGQKVTITEPRSTKKIYRNKRWIHIEKYGKLVQEQRWN